MPSNQLSRTDAPIHLDFVLICSLGKNLKLHHYKYVIVDISDLSVCFMIYFFFVWIFSKFKNLHSNLDTLYNHFDLTIIGCEFTLQTSVILICKVHVASILASRFHLFLFIFC